MELLGLQHQLAFFDGQGIPIHTLITDRHVSINNGMRENRPSVQHQFDIWDVAKVCLL